jgi:glycosyltransferase involved in cell wall biosynthesis
LALVWLGTADAVVVMTRAIEQNLREKLRRERVHYMPNFVGPSPLQKCPRRSTDVIRILFVGAVVEAKGILDLLEAVRELPGSHVRVAGPVSREFEHMLSGLISRTGGRVELLGSVSRERVVQLLCESDVFVLPTHREGFPISLLEAMSAGLAVVTTPVGAIPEIVRDGIDGILVPPRDVGALRAAIVHLASDPELRSRLGAQAAARVASEFQDSVVVPRLAALYRQLAGVAGVASE